MGGSHAPTGNAACATSAATGSWSDWLSLEQPSVAAQAAPLIHDRPIHELLHQPAIHRPDRARRLRHVDGDEFFLRIDPEERARITGPHVFALGTGDAG